MKKILTILLLAYSGISNGQKLISKWTFDNSTNLPDSGQGSMNTVGGAAFTSFVGGNPSTGKAYGTNTYPAQSQNNEKAGIRIRISTQGFKDISFSFAQYNSNTSSKKTMVLVSTDSINYTKVDSLIVTAGSAWFSKSIDFKSITALNNKSDIYVLLVSSFVGSQYAATGSASTYGTAGTWRFDNVKFYGNVSASPSSKPKLNITSVKSSLFEYKTDTATIVFKLSDTAKVNVKNKVNLTGTGITVGDYTWLGRDTLKIRKGFYSDTLKLKIVNDVTIESLETGIISIVNLDTNIILGTNINLSLVDDDVVSVLISTLQGKGNISPMLNSLVTTEGVVTADLQGTNEQGGFYMQDLIPDNDLSTSDGIFVSSLVSVAEGDLVKVSGKVIENFNQTIITQVTSISILSSNKLIAPVNLIFPIDSLSAMEKYEGMKIKVNQQLTVTENYQLGRYGEITTSVNGRLVNPSNFIDPNDNLKDGNNYSGTSNVAALLAAQSLNNRSKLLICDKLSIQNPNPIPFIDPIEKTLRSGSTIDSLVGVLGYDFGNYRLYPAIGHPKFKYAVRPLAPTIANSNVKISGFNVLNYFNGDGKGTGFPTARGAATLNEFQRQKSKIVAAMKALDADVFGLMEMENDGDSALSAINELVSSLNAAYGSKVYDYIRDSKGANGNPGSDAIKVALIYKVANVTPTGLSISHNDPSFTLLGRPPLAQTFVLNSNGEKFSVIVNHFKSKSCAASPADPLDIDQKDGQGCFNATRKKQATALVTFINTLIKQTNDSDVITIGDFNGYEQEDPIDILRAGSLKSLVNETYSYVFDGQSGSLDHAFATPSMYRSMTTAAKWHVNCDEPMIIDYTLTFKTQDLYTPIAYRSSDHDPLIAGFNLVKKVSSIVNANLISDVNIYPQPNKGIFAIASGSLENFNIMIYNTTGQLVYNECDLSNKSQVSTNLPTGIYYLHILAADSNKVLRLIIQ